MHLRAFKIRDPELQKYREQNASAHGGEFHKKRWGRSKPRQICDLRTMNLTLRSTQAKGAWSFRQPHHKRKVEELTRKFATRFDVLVLRLTNVGNHLHFHVKFFTRKSYFKIIRALTAAIAIAITGCSRWAAKPKKKFWDLRPFTRVIHNVREFDNYEWYLDLNDLQGEGLSREDARWVVTLRRWFGAPPRAGAG